MGFLKLIGAVSAAEHERAVEAGEQALRRMTVGRDDWKESSKRWEGRFKNAISDLAAAREEIESYKEGAKALHRGLDDYMAEINRLHEEIAALRPDAEKHRAKLDRDRNRVRPSRAKAPTKAVAAKGRGK